MMTNNDVTSNQAQNGGALWTNNILLVSNNCTWKGNAAKSIGGALAIYNSNYNATSGRKRAGGSSTTINGDTFDGNNADMGGAIGLSGSLYVSHSHLQRYNLTVVDCKFRGAEQCG